MKLIDQPSIHLSKNAKDISGHTFGLLTAIKPIGRQGPNLVWACSCSCGGEKAVIAAQLKAGKVASCGCLLTVPVHSAFIGPKQPRVTKNRWTQEEKKERRLARMLATAERNAANKLGQITATAIARIKAAQESMVLTEDELYDLCQLPIEEQATAITRATADKINKEKQDSYAYKLANDPKFHKREMEKALRRAKKLEKTAEADKVARAAAKAERAEELVQDASQHEADYLLIADTEARTLQEWFFRHRGPSLHNVPELKNIHAVVEELTAAGPGFQKWRSAWMQFIITRKHEPIKPDWYVALMKLYYTPMPIPAHVEWINDFNYEDYTDEQTANGRGVANAEEARSLGRLQAEAG